MSRNGFIKAGSALAALVILSTAASAQGGGRSGARLGARPQQVSRPARVENAKPVCNHGPKREHAQKPARHAPKPQRPENGNKPATPPDQEGKTPHGNNGVGNGPDPAPPGNPPVNDGTGTTPGNPGNTSNPT